MGRKERVRQVSVRSARQIRRYGSRVFVSSVRLRRSAAIAASAAAVLVLTGCGGGFTAQTNQTYDASVGSNHRTGEINILNALFVDNGDGTATFSAALLNKDTTAHVLSGVTTTTDEGSPIPSTLATHVLLKPQVPFSPGKDGNIIMTGKFPAGGFVKTTLTFNGAAPVTINAPVVSRTEIYKDVATTTVGS